MLASHSKGRGFGWAAARTLLLVTMASSPAGAIPALLQYQGHLSNGGGPVNGNVAMTFTLYGVPNGGAALWTESYPSVAVSGGVFNVLLGSNTVLPVGSLFAGQTLWIETVVDGNVMSPRRPIVSVGYAARAAIADSAVMVPPAVPAGSVVYTRWGRTTCPAGASVVYTGYAASGHALHDGSGRNALCLTNAPSWPSFSGGGGAMIYGVEFVAPYPLESFDARCVVCLKENVRVSLMIPGTTSCPTGWNLEYAGYLMATAFAERAGEFVCVDANPETWGLPNLAGGHTWWLTAAQCGVLPCPPYVQDRELTCAVCTRP